MDARPKIKAETPRVHRGGFTMIEIMFVIGIVGMIMAIGVPAIFNIMHKDTMRQGVQDIMDACLKARETAIIRGLPAELVFHPQDRSYRIQASATATTAAAGDGAPPGFLPEPRAETASAGPAVMSGRWSEDLELDFTVNTREHVSQEQEEVRMRFFPNGTCDDFAIMLQWPAKQQYRMITVDTVSSIPDVQILP